MAEITVRPGQVWGDAANSRELVLERVEGRYAYYQDAQSSRRGRIQLRRLLGNKKYHLRADNPASKINQDHEQEAVNHADTKTVQVDLRSRDPIYVECDRYEEEKQVEEGEPAET